MFGMIPFERHDDNMFDMFDNFQKKFFNDSNAKLPAFRTDIRDQGDKFLLEAELPGFQKEEISLELKEGILTIRAEHKESEEEQAKKGEYVRRERRYGSFARTFDVSGIDESGITAADESGLSIDGTTLTIEQAGTYVLSGTCSDGSVKVKKGVTGVTLVLSGLDLTSSTTAPIICGKSSGVTILAAEGTENALTDAAANNGDNYPDNADAENAVIKCKDGSQVTIGGTGTLTVTANGKNGIKSGATTDEEGTAWLVIEDLTLTINAPVNDAVNAEASLTVKSGTITIDAGDDALQALADKFAAMDNCSVLYNQDKPRVKWIVDTAKERGAKGVLVVLTKFCDPEEFDYVMIKKACEAAGIPLTLVEVDRQMVQFEQVRTNLETFRDLLMM